MEARIDVHLLTLNEPVEWREACVASLEGAPIQLHVLPGGHGRIGAARTAGFAQGTLPLVSFVDPDDTYEAGAFTQLADALDACPEAVFAYTDEVLLVGANDIAVPSQPYSRQQHLARADHVHGLIVMRRAAVESVIKEIAYVRNYAEWLLTLILSKSGSVLHLPIVGRHWRQHPQQSHLTGDPYALMRVHQERLADKNTRNSTGRLYAS